MLLVVHVPPNRQKKLPQRVALSGAAHTQGGGERTAKVKFKLMANKTFVLQ